MKLTIEISRGLVADSWGEYWGDCLCALGPGVFYSDYMCYDIDYCETGTRLPTRDEVLDFIDKVKKKYPDAIVEDGTGVLAAAK